MILAQAAHTMTESGIGLGAVIAIVLSWHRNKSIFYAIIHGILSWFYVIYFHLTREENEV
jgi:hypothetical protein